MGVFGWRLLAPAPQTLVGTVKKHEWNGGVLGDGDWSLFVAPDDPTDVLLSNRSGDGRTNLGGQIECEVEPSIDPTSDHDPRSSSEEQYFAGLVNKHVKVWGPWVADCSHSWDGNDCVAGNIPIIGGVFADCCDVGKTEIHPIQSIEAVISESPRTRVVEIFVFSDASDLIKPPNADQDISADFSIPFPSFPTGPVKPQFELVSETNQANAVTFNIVTSDTGAVLEVHVQSGTASSGKGFYHAAIALSIEVLPPTRHDSALIQGNYGQAGNYEMMVPMGDHLAHFWRNNDDPAFPWHGPTVLPPPASGPIGKGTMVLPVQFTGASLIETTVVPGNLDVVASVVTQLGDSHLVFYGRDSTGWHGPADLVADGAEVTGVTGL